MEKRGERIFFSLFFFYGKSRGGCVWRVEVGMELFFQKF